MTTHGNPPDQPEYLSVSDAAARLGCSMKPIRRAIRTGELKTVDIGTPDRKKLRIRVSDLNAWLDRVPA